MNRKFEPLIRELDDQIRCHPHVNRKLFASLSDLQRRLGIVHDDRPFCPFLRPYFLARSRYRRIAAAAETLSAAFEKLALAALESEEILDTLDLTERELQMARLAPGYSRLCVTSRLDAYLDGDDFKFLEYNAESPAGISDQMQIEKVLAEVPPVKEFLEKTAHWVPAPHAILLDSLVAAYRDFGGKKEKPSIAIVDWDGVSTRSEFVVLREYFESAGYPAIICDPRELEYDGENLRAAAGSGNDGGDRSGDFAIDIFYKRVIIHEFLEKFDETHPLARAYADGNICMANSFRVKLAHKKAGFAILSDEKYEKLFTAEQLEAINRHIPWTRRVREEKTTYRGARIDLTDFVRRERRRLVLKPNDDYGGHGIKMGWETSASDWDAALGDALTKSYVVQERASVGKETVPVFDSGGGSDEVRMETLLIDFDPFLFMGKIEGGLVRLSASSLVNVSQGGGETALVVLEDF